MNNRHLIGVAISLVLVIILIICWTYRKNNIKVVVETAAAEQFQNLEQKMNANKTHILDIMGLMNQHYPLAPQNIDVYGFGASDDNSPLKLEDMGNLNSEFQLKFIQQLQDAEITDLQRRLKNLPIVDKLKTNSVNSVKHMQTGKLFGLLKHPRQIGNQFSFMTDIQNGVCLKNIPGADPTENIDLTACDYNVNAIGQKYLLETVNNNNEFNDMLNETDAPEIYNKYKLDTLYGYGAYPFSVIKTAKKAGAGLYTAGTECITLDNSGFSIEPCTGKESQRFAPSDIMVDLPAL